MASLSTTLGLTGPHPPSLTAHYLIFHFLFAYAAIASRLPKMYYGFDHNVSPRDDLAVYGPRLVQKGRISQARLDQLKRVESCHANSIEHFTLFAATMLFAHFAGVAREDVNYVGLVYTLLRVGFVLHYIFNTSPTWSLVRSILYWLSSITCLRLIWKAGVVVNGKTY